MEHHLARWVGVDPDELLFTERHGGPLRRYTIERAWRRPRQAVAVPQLRLHDLRHTGNTPAVATGASTEELMARMGHASARAALVAGGDDPAPEATLRRAVALPDGTARTKTFRRRTDAGAYRQKVEADELVGVITDHRRGSITFDELADRWLASTPTKRARSAERDLSILACHMRPVLGSRQIRTIVRGDVQALVDGLAATRAPSSRTPLGAGPSGSPP